MKFKLDLQLFAHKKGVGSTKNGRDSESKRLGQKKSDGEMVRIGMIIYRQRGTKIHPGLNVKQGADDTLFALANGIIKYDEKNGKKRVNVVPVSEKEKAKLEKIGKKFGISS